MKKIFIILYFLPIISFGQNSNRYMTGSSPLTGLTTGNPIIIQPTDSLIGALAKLQAQISAINGFAVNNSNLLNPQVNTNMWIDGQGKFGNGLTVFNLGAGAGNDSDVSVLNGVFRKIPFATRVTSITSAISGSFIQNTTSPQTASFNVTGSGGVGNIFTLGAGLRMNNSVAITFQNVQNTGQILGIYATIANRIAFYNGNNNLDSAGDLSIAGRLTSVGATIWGTPTGASTDSVLSILNGQVREQLGSSLFIQNQAASIQTGQFIINGVGQAQQFVSRSVGTAAGLSQINTQQNATIHLIGLDNTNILHIANGNANTDIMKGDSTGAAFFPNAPGSPANSVVIAGIDTSTGKLVKDWLTPVMITPPGIPTVTIGAAAGTGGSPSATISATSARFMKVTIVTGSGSTGIGTLFTINFPNAWAQSPTAVWSWGYNGSSLAPINVGWTMKTNSTSQIEFDLVNASPSISSTYIFNISVGY